VLAIGLMAALGGCGGTPTAPAGPDGTPVSREATAGAQSPTPEPTSGVVHFTFEDPERVVGGPQANGSGELTVMNGCVVLGGPIGYRCSTPAWNGTERL
jgi:hypothetical protein